MIAFLLELRSRNEGLFYFGFACLVLAVACVLLIKFVNIQVLGVNAFYKPMKFFLSTTIFVWTMAWYCHYLQKPDLVWWYSAGLIVFFTIEDGYILLQAVRGEPSHFNLTTPFHQAMWGLMVVSAIAIALWTLVITMYFFNASISDLPDYYLWAIRLSLVIFFIFSLEGMAMGARMAHTVGGADGSEGLAVVNWSKRYGDLRVAHFFGMHSLQILPLLAYFVIKDVKVCIIISVLYALFVTLTLIQAIQGRSILKVLN